MKNAMREGMTIVEIGPNEPTLEAGRQSLDRIRAAGVTAVVAYNDLMAIGLVQEAAVQGVSVPNELSVIGFDNIFGSDFTSPPITTVQLELDRSGREAVTALLRQLSGESVEFSGHIEPDHGATLLIRGSVAEARKAK